MVHSFIYRERRLEVRMHRQGDRWLWSHGERGNESRETGLVRATTASSALPLACAAARAWVDRQSSAQHCG